MGWGFVAKLQRVKNGECYRHQRNTYERTHSKHNDQIAVKWIDVNLRQLIPNFHL